MDVKASNTVILFLLIALGIVVFVRPKKVSPVSGTGTWGTPYYLRYNTPVYNPSILNVMPPLTSGYGNGFSTLPPVL